MDASTTFEDVLRRSPSPLRGELPPLVADRPLRILFVTSAHNGLSQRAYIALTEMGHDVTVQVVDSREIIETAVEAHRPDLVVCPMLKKLIPESVWRNYTCLAVHPGPVGDRGPSSLDWAIELGAQEWGVTVLEANGEARRRHRVGDVWAFRVREAGNSQPVSPRGPPRLRWPHNARGGPRGSLDDLWRRSRSVRPTRPAPTVTGRPRPFMTQDGAGDRLGVARTQSRAQVRAAEGHPGVLDAIAGTRV